MINQLLLLSGNDIPFPTARLIIHPPKIKEIGLISQETFWEGCELLRFEKNVLNEDDQKKLFEKTNLDILLSVIQEKNIQSQQARIKILSLFTIMFPSYQIKITKNSFQLKNEKTEQISYIDNDNFEAFKEILINMFCLTKGQNKEYNPSGQLSKKIAQQFKKGREKRAKLAPASSNRISVLSRYISILSVGLKKDINALMNYTVYQLMEEFERFKLKINYDTWEKYRIAGAEGLKDPEDWLKDLHQDQ